MWQAGPRQPGLSPPRFGAEGPPSVTRQRSAGGDQMNLLCIKGIENVPKNNNKILFSPAGNFIP